MAEEVVVVVEVDIFDEGNMKEEETVSLAGISLIDQTILRAEPVDLIRVHTVITVDAEAV